MNCELHLFNGFNMHFYANAQAMEAINLCVGGRKNVVVELFSKFTLRQFYFLTVHVM